MYTCPKCNRKWPWDGSQQQDNRCFGCGYVTSKWDVWINNNLDNLNHPMDYELQFVNTILKNIPNLSPNDVFAQHHFIDQHGKNRYIDFMIKNDPKNYLLPIELDGFWKVSNYSDFNDMLSRQNALISKYRILLRYTNAQMQYNPEKIISEITDILQSQSRNESIENIDTQKNSNVLQFTESLKDQIKNSADQSEITELTKMVIYLVTNTINQPSPQLPLTPTPTHLAKTSLIPTTIPIIPKPQRKSPVAIIVIVAFILFIIAGVGLFVSYSKKNVATHENTQPKEITNQSQSLLSNSVSNSQEESQQVIDTHKITEPPTSQSTAQYDANQTQPVEPQQQEKPVLTTPTAATDQNINAKSASQYLGEYKIVCGSVAQVKSFTKGTYLNLGSAYPNQDLTIVIWSSDENNFGDLTSFEGKDLCVTGEIGSYKGIPQIQLKNTSQIL